MKKFNLVMFFLIFFSLAVFGEPNEQEEIDYLLFLPNSSDRFVNQEQAINQLDNTARYLKEQNLVSGQVIVYGYAAFSSNNIDPMDISKERALFVINELQRRGISKSLFADPVGYGSVYLWGSNSTEEDKVPNRRVRILIDGTIITPEVIAVPNIADTMLNDKLITIEETEEPELIKPLAAEPKIIKEKSNFKFPWWILLPLLLIPLLFLLFRSLKNRKREDKPVVKKAAPPKPEPEPQPVVQKSTAPDPAPQPVVQETPIIPVAPIAAKPIPSAPVYVEEIVDLEEEIRRRAYFHSQGHGYCDMDGDWFVAVPRVRVEYEEKGYDTYMENGTWWAKRMIIKK